MYKHDFGQTLTLQSAVVTVNIRSRSLKSNSHFSVSNKFQESMQVWCRKKHTFGLEDRAQKRLNLQFSRMVTLK